MSNNTGNPVPSISELDFEDNCENLDKAMTSNDLQFTDRLGVDRYTWHGLTELVEIAAGRANNAKGWSPVFGIETNGEKNALKLVSYSGGTGDVPTNNIGRYLGPAGYVTNINSAVDVRGVKGDLGNKGWTPQFSLVANGEKVVQRLVSWVGGEGTAPTQYVGYYVGTTGYVSNINDGIDVRGPKGVDALPVRYVDTRPEGVTLATSLPTGSTVWIDSDATYGGVRTRNIVSGGLLTNPTKVTADTIAATGGVTVQQKLDEIVGGAATQIQVDSAINVHNSDAGAHPALSAFITNEANRAESAADAADVSAAAALAAQNTYASTVAGLAGTTSGQVFLVATADPQVFDVYRNDAGSAVLLGTLRIADQADVGGILEMLDIGDHGSGEGFAIIDDHENVIAELTSESEFRVPSLSAQLAKIDIAEVEQIDVVPVEGGSVVQVVDDHGNVAAEITPQGLFRAELEAAVVEIVPGSGVEVNNSNPMRPVISANASGALSYRSPGDVGGKPFNKKESWSAHHLLLTASTTISPGLSGSASIYWPCIVTTERLESPLGRYYMFFSTDHAAGQGGIFKAYADSILGPWTPLGRVYWDPAGLQTETPDVLWSEYDQCWVMYYQQHSAKYGPDDSLTPLGVQSTLCATSTDLITWTKDPNFVIQKVPSIYGDGHTGYFRPYWTPEGLCASSLFGGTDYSMNARYRHRGGTLKGYVSGGLYLNQWEITDIQPTFFESDKRSTSMLDQKLIWSSGGIDWAITTYGQTASGAGSRVVKHYAVPLDKNRRNIFPDVRYEIWEPEEAFDGGGDIRSGLTFVEDGVVYVFYTTAVGSTNSNRLGVFYYEQ